MRFFGKIQSKYIFYLTICVSGMILFAVFGSRGLVQIYHLKDERARIQASNARMQEENKKLAWQIDRLRHSKEEVEKVAREDLGLVREGEIVYQFEK